MTKEQKIKEVYGDNYQKLCTYIDENGILIDPLTSKEVDEFLQENIDNFEWVDVDSYMPKSLYGIENNNGWEKYDYEKLPEEIFEKFTQQMKHELEVNNHKGDWIPFTNREEILSEIDHHVNKLKKSVLEGDNIMIKEHSADVANISLFMFNTTL